MTILKDKSITNNTWSAYMISNQDYNQIVNIYKVNPIIAKILTNRNIDIKSIPSFLNPKIKEQMPDPYVLNQMQEACLLITEAINKKDKIILLSDYDVDGITSIAMLYQYLGYFNENIENYLPDRYKEGYGISIIACNNIIAKKPDLVILLDNGSNSHEEIKLLKDSGIKVIIIDHHAVDTTPTKADCLINPKRLDEKSNLDYLCTAGITFLMIVALNRLMKNNQNIDNNINIMKYLDLVALGTVCDMVPLINLNRSYVFQGIKVLNQRNNLALKTFSDSLNINKPIDVETLGYVFGPCINAGSRMGNSYLPLNLLLSTNVSQASLLSQELISCNKNRQQEEDKIVQSAVYTIENKIIDNNQDNFIFVGDNSWLAGVIGIIASRIKEIYKKPTCIYTIDKQNHIATASGRSMPKIDLGTIILGAKQRNLIIKGGGHSQAVGFSFYMEKKDELFNFINSEITKIKNTHNLTKQYILVDALVPLNNINEIFIEEIMKMSPFGMNFAEPVFMSSKVKISAVKQIGINKNHLQCNISDDRNFTLKAFCYKCLPGKLGEEMINRNNSFIDLLFTVSLNFYKGKYYSNLIIKDIA
jgi:single-stranded-DNA-specific exonuclease